VNFHLSWEAMWAGLALLLFGLESCDGAARHFDLYLLGDTQQDGVAFKSNDRAIDTAVRNYLIAGFQVVQHRRGLFLAPLGRKDHQKVEDDHDEDEREKQGEASGLGRGLHEHGQLTRNRCSESHDRCALLAIAGKPVDAGGPPEPFSEDAAPPCTTPNALVFAYLRRA
jgi:hypothetical protein